MLEVNSCWKVLSCGVLTNWLMLNPFKLLTASVPVEIVLAKKLEVKSCWKVEICVCDPVVERNWAVLNPLIEDTFRTRLEAL